MSSVGRCLLVLCIFVCASRSGSAAETGSIVGKVVDQTGAGLPGVTIELATAVGGATTVSDATGAYRFDVAPVGPAELTFRLINFAVPRRTVTVAAVRHSPAM
jgi:iron complex outermembrane receptor protein